MSKCKFIICFPPTIIPFPPLTLPPIPDLFISFSFPSLTCPLD